MEKTPRYTQRERNMVLTYAAQHKDVIENKRTDAESNRKKDEVWLQIAKDFNGKVYHQRSAKQLRQLYKNMKLLLKKDLCGEDKGNRSFLDLLNTLSQQDSVAQYIAEQMSPDGAGSQATGNGRHLADDYEDSKLPLYEGMDTDVILIKSETISDNEQTENGMDCMDDDDDDDCPSPKAPEVCLEEEDGVLFPTDRSHLQQHSGGGSIASNQVNGNGNGNNGIGGSNIDALPRAPSSPVCSTKTSISSTGSYMSAGQTPKAEITLTSVGNIRVGAFASINNTLHNGNSNSSSNNNNNNNNNINSSSNKNNNNSNNGNNVAAAAGGGNSLQLTAEQMQQHLLLNGLGLSAVQHPPAGQSLQAAINAATSGVGSGRQTQTLQLPRLQRGHNAAASAAAATNGGNSNATGVQLLLNGHQTSRDKSQQQQQLHQQQLQQQQQQQLHPSGSITLAAGSFNGYNGLGVINCGPISSGSNNSHNNSASSSGSGSNNNNNHNHNNSSGNLQTSSQNNHNNHNNISGSHNTSGGSNSGTRGQHNEYMMTLAVEERKLKIELLNAQIKYWETLTKKLDSQSGHYPNPACPCHFPGTGVIGGVAAAGSAAVAVAANALQTQSSSS